MSRAFVKEREDEPENVVVRTPSARENFVTESGLKDLHKRLEEAQRKNDAAEVTYLQSRIESAMVVNVGGKARKTAGFGATVTIEDPDGKPQTYRIVGEDEADPRHGTISWISPLAEALDGLKVGQTAVWDRPAGPLHVKVTKIAYER